LYLGRAGKQVRWLPEWYWRSWQARLLSVGDTSNCCCCCCCYC